MDGIVFEFEECVVEDCFVFEVGFGQCGVVIGQFGYWWFLDEYDGWLKLLVLFDEILECEVGKCEYDEQIECDCVKLLVLFKVVVGV